MRRSHPFLVNIMVGLVFFFPASFGEVAWAQGEPLKLLISIEQQSIVAPWPARIMLHIHNAGNETLWLYRPAEPAPSYGSEMPMEATESQTAGGSTLRVHLEPANKAGPSPASGVTFSTVGLPRPALVRLDPGDDIEEKTAVRFFSADVGADGKPLPIWGMYQLSVTYSAKYSNADEVKRLVGATLWQGEVTSNAVDLEIDPPPADATATISGTVTDSAATRIEDALVTLTDKDERWVSQSITNREGEYSFGHLPVGLYWLTVQLLHSPRDTAVFRHVELTPSDPDGTLDFTMYSSEIVNAKQLLHKPVLLRVTDSAGSPEANVKVVATLVSGKALDNVKGETSADGLAPLSVIPGRSFISLNRKGCAEDDERADVAPGSGVDAFSFTYDCEKK